MKKNLQIISSAIVMTLFFTFPAFAGQWIQDAGRPAVSDGVSNWRWQEDDGTYVQDCDLWLDGNKDGIYENYYFNSGGWMLAATQNGYGQTINSDGALLNNDGSVFRIIAPKDSAVITTPDYTLTLPENWKNNFCYSLRNGNLYVDFHPIKPLLMDGKNRGSVTQAMFWILSFDSREEMEKIRNQGLYDSWRLLGSSNGKYYVSCGPTDTAIEFYTEEDRAVMQQMQSALYENGQSSLWNRMGFVSAGN